VSRWGFVAAAARWALRQFTTVIAVSEEVKAGLSPHLPESTVPIIPDYLSADPDDRLDPAASEFFRASGKTIVVAAFRVDPQAGGGDLYGLDTAVEAFILLAADEPGVRLALFIAVPPRGRSARYLARLAERVAATELNARFLVRFRSPLLPALVEPSAIFVRPTRSDGDSVSIREALSAGIPVIASDVVNRPAGVTLFPTGDALALARAAAAAIPGRSPRGVDLAQAAPSDDRSLDELVAVYESVLARSDSHAY
jgi:glycosyltransferase involved in cell wall biosynthesis